MFSVSCWVYYQTVKSERHMRYVVINSDGTCIANKDGKRVTLTKEQVGRSLELRKSGTIEMSINGVSSTIYYSPIDHVDWAIALVVPNQGVVKPLMKFGIILLLVSILGMIVVWMMCRKLRDARTVISQ